MKIPINDILKMRRSLLFFICLIFPFILFAKHFKVFDISTGLPNNTVKCIIQDEQGFIWLGTFNGLCRFDGVDFAVFTHQQNDSLSIINNHIEALLPVENGMWVGTEGGLNFYSYTENRFYPCIQRASTGETQLMTRPIKNIVMSKGKVFVLNVSRELFVLRDNQTFEKCDYEANMACLAIALYKDGMLLAHTTKGICLIEPEKGRIVGRLNIPQKMSSDNVIYYSKNKNRIYIGYGIGYNSEVFSVNDSLEIRKLDEPVPSDVKSVIDYKDETVFGTDGNGLATFSTKEENFYTPENSNISSDAIHSLFVDRNENLWIGTYRGGVNLFSVHYNWFKTLTMANKQITHNVVTAIYPGKDHLYIGLDGGGLNVYDQSTGRVTAYTTRNSSIAGNNILSISGDEQYIWLGIYGRGLCRFSLAGHSFKNFVLPSIDGSMNMNRIWEIKDDGRGYIWIIGEGVYLFNKETETFITISELNGVYASGVVFDDNVAWLSCTNSGLYKMDRVTGKILKHYFKDSKETPIDSNIIRYIFIDSNHCVWFSTEYSGLYKLDEATETVTSCGKSTGLTSQSTVSMQEDQYGNIWLGTDNGLFRYSSATGTFVRFGKEDNLSLVQFNYNACSRKEDILYFGTTGGLVWFNPSEIEYSQRANSVYFIGLELLNNDKELINLYGDHPQEIRLPYDQNFFTIHFSTPELVSPDKINFSCFMENFEKNWQEISYHRQVSYTNVPPGEYLFYVKSSDSNGKWNEKASCLKIIITPPWWQTGWAFCLWGIIILGILVLVLWFYQHELSIKHMVRLKEIEKNTAKSISEAKLNFFTNITHELRTPIFLITAPLEELMSSAKGPVQVPKSYLSAMYRNAMRLNKLISRIIDFRKLESGKLKLETQRLNVVAFCKDLTIDYEALCQQKNILFYFQPSKTVIQLDFDAEKLESILSNLISNAFKYTSEEGKIIFSIDDAEDAVLFTIEDNGIGIPEEYHDVIFDSFFQVDPSRASAMGDGIGLSFVKHLVELHGGTVKVESQPERGAKFMFSIPKKDVEEVVEQLEQKSVIIDFNETDSRQNELVSPQLPTAIHSLLIIDDERETVEILERFLIKDFKILKASNGVDGLTIAQEALPDIIICDMMMPKMDGMEFLSLVKGDKKLSHIPVIMFTAKTSEDDKMAAFDSGADAYLTKPVSLKYLRKRIDNLLSQSESVAVVNHISNTEKNYSKEEQRFLLKCREIIDNHLTDADFDVLTFAEKLGMSHSTLYRKVKSVTGMSVIEFINEYRIFKAVQYFNEGETNISTVGVKCGFNDLKNFRAAFKRKVGVSPKQYVMRL